MVNLSRFYGFSAEDALNKTISKFTGRFAEIERQMHEQGRELADCSLEEMDAIWEEAKKIKGKE